MLHFLEPTVTWRREDGTPIVLRGPGGTMRGKCYNDVNFCLRAKTKTIQTHFYSTVKAKPLFVIAD